MTVTEILTALDNALEYRCLGSDNRLVGATDFLIDYENRHPDIRPKDFYVKVREDGRIHIYYTSQGYSNKRVMTRMIQIALSKSNIYYNSNVMRIHCRSRYDTHA